MYNFEQFINEHADMFEKCKYPFCKHKSTLIVRKIFFDDNISKKEIKQLETWTGVTPTEWRQLIDKYNCINENEFEEQPMDANNICTAP